MRPSPPNVSGGQRPIWDFRKLDNFAYISSTYQVDLFILMMLTGIIPKTDKTQSNIKLSNYDKPRRPNSPCPTFYGTRRYLWICLGVHAWHSKNFAALPNENLSYVPGHARSCINTINFYACYNDIGPLTLRSFFQEKMFLHSNIGRLKFVQLPLRTSPASPKLFIVSW